MKYEGWLARPVPVDRSRLPSRARLIGATVAVLAMTVVLLLTVVLPGERGIDPTGLGAVTGLTELGLFKVESAEEFKAIAAIAAQNVADSIAAQNRADSIAAAGRPMDLDPVADPSRPAP